MSPEQGQTPYTSEDNNQGLILMQMTIDDFCSKSIKRGEMDMLIMGKDYYIQE